MKLNRKIKLSVLFLLVAVIAMSSMQFSVTPTVSQPSVPREDIVWATGYWAPPADWNPFFWEQAFGTAFMYLPLFESNFETGELIPLIGESMEWSNNGKTLTISLRNEAKWSDGSDITSQDVIYSYENLLAPMRLEGFSDRVTNMAADGNKQVVVTLNDTFAYTRMVWESFIGYNLVVPKAVWEAVVTWAQTEFGDWEGYELMEFKNNWLEEGFNSAWKVSSGPYQPYYVDLNTNTEIYKKVDNWWGNTIDVLGEPEPEYIGHIGYDTNYAGNAAFANDEIDWFGNYYPRIWELFSENPNIHCWENEDPYFAPLGQYVTIAPNHLRYPFDQVWLRQALAYAINYNDMSEVSASGYLEQARPGFIDDRSPLQEDLYDETVTTDHSITYNPTRSIEILNEHCIQNEGVWYTKDTPASYLGQPGSNNESIVDELPGEPGINVHLGDWDIAVPYGWTDSMMQTTLLATYFNEIGISTTPAFIEEGTYTANFEAMDYDIMNWGMGFNPLATGFQAFNYFTGTAGQWVNISGWYNPEFKQKKEQFEVTQEGSTEEETLASELQGMLAEEIPEIPLFPNGYWYAYNSKYWSGWANAANPFIQVTAPWEVPHAGAMLLLILNLQPTGAVAPTPLDSIPVFLALTVVGSVTVVMLRKRRKLL